MKVKTLEQIAKILEVSPCELLQTEKISNMVEESSPGYSGVNSNSIIDVQNQVIKLLTSELEECRERLK